LFCEALGAAAVRHSLPPRRSSDLADRMDRLDELRRRWDEQHEKLRVLVANLKVKAEANDGFASRYRAAQTRLRRLENAGPPEERDRKSTRLNSSHVKISYAVSFFI